MRTPQGYKSLHTRNRPRKDIQQPAGKALQGTHLCVPCAATTPLLEVKLVSLMAFVGASCPRITSESLSTNIIVEVRQLGWTTPNAPVERREAHQVLVADCTSLHTPRNERTIPPGECGIMRADINDLSRDDGWLVFTFRGSMTGWPSLTNPFNIGLRFGHWGTTAHIDTGEVERRCVYPK